MKVKRKVRKRCEHYCQQCQQHWIHTPRNPCHLPATALCMQCFSPQAMKKDVREQEKG